MSCQSGLPRGRKPVEPMNARSKTVAIHLLFWMLYVVAEYFANLMHLRAEERLRFFRSMALSMPILVFSTYFIALFAVPRFLKTERWGFFVLSLFVVAVFVFYGRIKWLEFLNYFDHQYYKVPVAKVLSNIIRDYSIIALAVCIYIIGDYRRERRANIELVKSKAEAEIKLLKGQLHPHFLFNSLNNLYSLALVKSDMTADSILKLTELLDYLVYRANMDKVALVKEVQLLNNYIGLEQLRYGEHLHIETDIVVKNDQLLVAPLLLLPFAENCFKHGGPAKDGLFRVSIRMCAGEEQLEFEIVNSKKDTLTGKKKAGGVGLANIQQRLSLLYPGRHKLYIDQQPDSYRVKLQIVIRDEKI